VLYYISLVRSRSIIIELTGSLQPLYASCLK
jgi:hypothetical protein